ncbi:MAG: hypothetical protein Q8M15_10615 [Bacteroidota bacterium]|nr:hypothetical protein [Bacteroidota bacterium]
MKLVLILFVMLTLPLYGQDIECPMLHFTHSVKGHVKSYKLNHRVLVLLKSRPANPYRFPKSLDNDGKYFSLKLSRQNGQELVFNDSIHFLYSEIESIYLKDRKNPGRYTAGIITFAGIGASMAYNKNLGIVILALYGVLPAIYFYQISKDVIYTKEWKLDNQHTPEIYYPQKNVKAYNIWPDLFERYK